MDQLRSAVVRVFQRGVRITGMARRSRRAAKAGVALALVLGASIALFASLDAGRLRPAPLGATYPTLDAMAEAVIAAVEAGDAGGLQALALTEQEFRSHVWPELPASRPERNVPFDFVWGMLRQNSQGHLQQTLSRFKGKDLTLVRVRTAGESTDYEGVTVHRDTELVVKDESGTEQQVRLFGSTIEQNGRYKVFSFVVDD